MDPRDECLRYIIHLKLRTFHWFCLSGIITFSIYYPCCFLSTREKISQINIAAIEGTTDSESNFSTLLYLFMYIALKQHPIKKLYKVVIGKTILKSSVLSNKPTELLNRCPLLVIQVILYQSEACKGKKKTF